MDAPPAAVASHLDREWASKGDFDELETFLSTSLFRSACRRIVGCLFPVPELSEWPAYLEQMVSKRAIFASLVLCVLETVSTHERRFPRTYRALLDEIRRFVYFHPDATELTKAIERTAHKAHTRSLLRKLYRGVLAYKRCRARLLHWLERAQLRIDAYGENGPARNRDRDAFLAEGGGWWGEA
tara:strand:+ start:1217 stop:1768 length:552 start_codon:yes stop_codon:yes gene_type:complete